MGTRDDLRKMIATCRGLNVRVYADAVLNHMTGGGNDASLTHRDGNCNMWTMKNSSASAPSPFYNQDYQYIPNQNTGLPPSQVRRGLTLRARAFVRLCVLSLCVCVCMYLCLCVTSKRVCG